MLYNWYIIGERIRTCRESKGWTQERLALEIDLVMGKEEDERPLSRQHVARWEAGKGINNFQHVAALAAVFECDVHYILCECDTKHAADEKAESVTGLAPIVIDRLIEYKKMQSHFMDIIPFLLADERLLEQIYKCCIVDYAEAIKTQSAVYDASILLSDNPPPARYVLRSEEQLAALDSLMLYDRLKEFIDKVRVCSGAAVASGLSPLDFQHILQTLPGKSRDK